MTDSVHPEAATSEGASAVDQVAELLSGGSEEAAKPKDLSEDYVEYPDTEETELEASGDDDEGDLETDEPNEQDDDDDDGDVLVNLKVNGKTEQVSLKDAISQTQYYKANEQKAQTLAEERKAFDSERQQVSENFQQQMNQVQGLGLMLEKKLQADYQAIDWDRLRVSDPAEWTAKQHEFQKAQQELQQAGQMVGEQMRQARPSAQRPPYRRPACPAQCRRVAGT